MDDAQYEAATAQDKLAAGLYSLQAGEKELALSLVNTLRTLEAFYRRGLESLATGLPALEEQVRASKRTKVFGEELSVHLRWTRLGGDARPPGRGRWGSPCR
jgi:hypothetical protein